MCLVTRSPKHTLHRLNIWKNFCNVFSKHYKVKTKARFMVVNRHEIENPLSTSSIYSDMHTARLFVAGQLSSRLLLPPSENIGPKSIVLLVQWYSVFRSSLNLVFICSLFSLSAAVTSPDSGVHGSGSNKIFAGISNFSSLAAFPACIVGAYYLT